MANKARLPLLRQLRLRLQDRRLLLVRSLFLSVLSLQGWFFAIVVGTISRAYCPAISIAVNPELRDGQTAQLPPTRWGKVCEVEVTFNVPKLSHASFARDFFPRFNHAPLPFGRGLGFKLSCFSPTGNDQSCGRLRLDELHRNSLRVSLWIAVEGALL